MMKRFGDNNICENTVNYSKCQSFIEIFSSTLYNVYVRGQCHLMLNRENKKITNQYLLLFVHFKFLKYIDD